MVNLQNAIIREEDIKALLKQHQNTTTTLPKSNLLLYLNIVDDFLRDSNQTLGEDSREYAINVIVIDIIADEYHNQCNILGISADMREDVNQMLDIVRQGGRKFAQLSSLIILYFIHARPDSNLSYDELPDLIANSSRNIIRIKALGIKTIQNSLIQHEISSRRRHLEHRLRQSLPNRGYINLVERDREIEELKNVIDKNKNVLIKGVSGVGKSAIIESVVDRIIAEIHAETVILWLDMHQNADIEANIRGYFPKIAFDVLQNYLAQINTIIIVDNASHEHIHYLDRHFSLAKIIAMSQNMLLEAHFWHHVYHLKPLNPTSSERLIQHILQRYSDVALDRDTSSNIISASKGIAKHIISSVISYCNDHQEQLNNLDCYLALTKHTWLDIHSITDFWSPEITLDTLSDHPNIEIAMIDGKSYARLRDHVFIQFDENTVQSIYKILYRNRLLNLPIFPDVIYGLMQYNFKFDDEWFRYVLNQYSDKVDGWISWLENALTRTDDLSVYSDVIVRLSRYHRRIGQPKKYLDAIEKIKTHSAQIEMLHCLRASSEYTLAFERLENLLNSKRMSVEAQNELILLKVQLCIDVDNLDDVQKLLRQIESYDNPSYRLIHAKLSTLMPTNASIDIYREYETGDHSVDSYHHYLIACQNYAENPEIALQYFLKGLQIINQQTVTNKLIVGRYLYNIGACYIRLNCMTEAKTYLYEALNMQQLIGDKLGIIYTEKSLSELE